MKGRYILNPLLVLMMVATIAILFGADTAVGAGSSEPARGVETLPLSSAAAGVPGARFVHLATATNTTDFTSYLDHPLTTGNPNAIVLVTQNYNPGGVGATYNDHEIGVMYDITSGRWAIYNQDLADIPVGAAFDVLVVSIGAPAFVHTATAANIHNNHTHIDHPLTNGNPAAVVLVTQNLNPGGAGGTVNDHSIGVHYDGVESKWAVFNQDGVAMPEGAGFNVLTVTTDPAAKVHTATAENIVMNYTLIDHPLANENPNAMVHMSITGL